MLRSVNFTVIGADPVCLSAEKFAVETPGVDGIRAMGELSKGIIKSISKYRLILPCFLLVFNEIILITEIKLFILISNG